VDFSKPVKAPGTRPFPPHLDAPSVDDAETGAGSDFWIRKPVLGPADNSRPSSPNPMSVVGPGLDTSQSLASRLHWRPVSANTHPQTWLSYQGRPVPIDTNIAPLIEALWQAGYPSLACCEGEETAAESGYVMFCKDIGERFMSWAQAHERSLSGALMQRFEVLLQDDDWHEYMAKNFPLLEPVAHDANGRLFTISWRFHREDLLDNREQLVALLLAS